MACARSSSSHRRPSLARPWASQKRYRSALSASASSNSPSSMRERQRRTDIVELCSERRQPARRLRPTKLLPGATGEVGEVLRVPTLEVDASPPLRKPLLGELADRHQHPEAIAAVPDEALVDERRERVQIRRRRPPRPASSVQPPAKTDSPREQPLLLLVQQVVAPRDRRRRASVAARERRAPPRSGAGASARVASRICSRLSTLTRAAASSSASGRLSSRAQIAATTSVGWKSGSTTRARAPKKPTASSETNGWHVVLLLGGDAEAARGW